MTRCPNCGSTAQVRLIRIKYDRHEYKCGCGYEFFRKSSPEKVIELYKKNQKKG